MNILFVHEVDWQNKLVFDIHTIAEALSLRGHTIYAVDYENTWKREGCTDLGSFRTREFHNVSRAFDGASVELIRPGFIKIGGISRITAAITHRFTIRRIIREKRIDAIVLYSVPTNGLQVLSAAKDAGIPVLFRSLDVLNQLVPVPFLRPITRFLEKQVYRRADRILSLTPGLTGYMQQLGADEAAIRPLLMPVDMNIFYPGAGTDDVREKWGIGPEDRVVLFMGTLFDFSGLDEIIPRFSRVVAEFPTAKLLIVGDGPQRKTLDEMIEQSLVRNSIVITGFEPYELMPSYINLADICVNTFAETGATRDIFPGKSVQFLACGKPYIATPLPGMVAVIEGEDQGVVYAGSPDDMIDSILSLLRSSERCVKLGKAGLEYVKRVHSFDSVARQLEEYIVEAIGTVLSASPGE